MPSLKDLRNRIASVKATRKITKAMQMVAAAKLCRAQEAAVAARPYSDRMAAVIGNLSSAMEGREGAPLLLTGTGQAGRVGVHRRHGEAAGREGARGEALPAANVKGGARPGRDQGQQLAEVVDGVVAALGVRNVSGHWTPTV